MSPCNHPSSPILSLTFTFLLSKASTVLQVWLQKTCSVTYHLFYLYSPFLSSSMLNLPESHKNHFLRSSYPFESHFPVTKLRTFTVSIILFPLVRDVTDAMHTSSSSPSPLLLPRHSHYHSSPSTLFFSNSLFLPLVGWVVCPKISTLPHFLRSEASGWGSSYPCCFCQASSPEWQLHPRSSHSPKFHFPGPALLIMSFAQ